MRIQEHFVLRSTVLKSHVNKYAILGLIISITSIILSTLLVSYQQSGGISLTGIIDAQWGNPAIWALDITPFMFAYWGQSFCYELASKAESILDETAREFENKSGDLKLKLQYESNHDYLTNLPNHRLLAQRIDQGIKQIQKEDELALILLSINDFKEINYQFGSFSANSLLLQFSEKLKTILLEPYLLQAYMGMNMIARLQGAEFAILIPRLRKEHHLESILIKLLEDTSLGFMINGNTIKITTTAGIAFSPLHGDAADLLIQKASLSLLYAEKKKIRYAVYDPMMASDEKISHVVLKELKKAIDNEEITLLYQPEYEIASNTIIGAEVVINYLASNFEVLSTERLLSLIEGTTLIKPLTGFVLNQAIKQLGIWQQANKMIYLTVNLFDVTDLELPSYVDNLLKTHAVSPNYLKLAVTEKACLSDQNRSLSVLNQLAALGIQLVISDFCSGYSSFVYLTNFPIHEIKIDKSIIMNMGTDEKRLTIVKAIIKLAEALQVVVFAEGIQEEKIVLELKKLGCLYGQGLYFSGPVAPELVGGKQTSTLSLLE